MAAPRSTSTGLHRIQSTAVQRAVGKRSRRLFKPKLVIAKNSIGAIKSICSDVKEKYIAIASENKQIRIWNLLLGKEYASFASDSICDTLIFSKTGMNL